MKMKAQDHDSERQMKETLNERWFRGTEGYQRVQCITGKSKSHTTRRLSHQRTKAQKQQNIKLIGGAACGEAFLNSQPVECVLKVFVM